MDTKKLLRKLNLTDNSFRNIRDAVAAAERKTSGEIALVLTYKSDSYSFWKLQAALAAGTLVFAVLIPFARQIQRLMEWLFWDAAPWQLPASYGLAFLCVSAAAFFFSNTGNMNRLFVPQKNRMTAVWERSLLCFIESGVYKTKARSGILIFVSYMEQQVRVVADSGISEKISHDMWNMISDELAEGISAGKAEQAFIRAVEECGELLQQYFPADKDNPNELADGLVVLGE